MSDKAVWELLLDSLSADKPCALLIALQTTGSGPGSPGAYMAVSGDGRTVGTIGGGSMERILLDTAIRIMNKRSVPELYRHYHSENSPFLPGESSGMICSGSQISAVIPFSSADIPLLRNTLEFLSNNRTGYIRVSPAGIEISSDRNVTDFSFVETGSGDWEFTGPFGLCDVLYIIGGGHVGRAVADLARRLQFRTLILDERENPPDELPGVEWITCPYRNSADLIPDGANSWVVIMTPDHAADSEVLESLQEKRVRYIGMMASESKRKTIFNRLLDRGVSRDYLDNIYSPIGIPIHSRTPMEIAVSIAAQLIRVRS
jgi:xanthine dehydrogenase accessory factor